MTTRNRTIAAAVKTLLFGAACLFLAAAAPCPCLAKVQSKRCSNCHTMHNSQGGMTMYEFHGDDDRYTTYARDYLLTMTCEGCHTATDGTTWKDPITGAPIVVNTAEPNYGADAGDGRNVGLAAGNFYWVTQGNAKGHNIFVEDPRFGTAPGHNTSGYCMDCCHDTLTHLGKACSDCRYASPCGNCHMVTGDYSDPSNTKWHHRDDSGPVVDTVEEGWYRFLGGHNFGDARGVSGIEDPDWEHSPTSTTHNEYLGYVDDDRDLEGGLGRMAANTMSGYCMGCHDRFHVQDASSGASPWLKHPSDTELPNSGEYTAYTTYNPLAPVARPTLSSVSSTVTPGTDLVFCLSCHRAHASPYSHMLRWDYKSDYSADLGEMISGCGVCHTIKY